MEEIKLSSGIEVKVNDHGETITLNVEDQQFTEKFYGLLDRMNQAKEHMESENVKSMNEHDQLKESIKATKGIMQHMDEIFGANTCRKVFGNIVPNMYLIADFFYQIKPIVDKYMGRRRSEINARYNSARKGGGQLKYPYNKNKGGNKHV